MGFTPLLYVCFRGYRTIGEKDVSLDNRYRIVEKLLEVGADQDKSREVTQMTPLHWLAFNGDQWAIQVLLDNGANFSLMSRENNLPIDIAGTMPNYECIDTFLQHYEKVNDI